jgi:hypothetical protein
MFMPMMFIGTGILLVGFVVGEVYLVIGGAIVGSLGVLLEFASWFKPPK